MWAEIAAGVWLVGEYLYHRLNEPPPPPPPKELQLPTTADGAPVPLIYGMCRVRQPLIAWIGTPHVIDAAGWWIAAGFSSGTIPSGTPYYVCSMLMVLGIGVDQGIHRLHTIWAGEQRLLRPTVSVPTSFNSDLVDLDGNGHTPVVGQLPGEIQVRGACVFSPNFGSGPFEMTGGSVEFLNGKSTQMLIDFAFPSTGNARYQAGAYMSSALATGTTAEDLNGDIPPTHIPGYRGYLGAFLASDVGTSNHWLVGGSPQLPAYSFEVSSYLAGYQIGFEMNPVQVLADLITVYFGKIGYDYSKIDQVSFILAAATIAEEKNGYSRAIEQGQSGDDVIQEILQQIDATLFEDASGLIKIKLIRGDYDPALIFKINQSNCVDLQDVAFSGWANIFNKITVSYTNRLLDYAVDTVTVQNLADVVQPFGQIREAKLSYPGVCDYANAIAIANRELAVRSRPLARCKAVMDRSAMRLNPGDPVLVDFPKYNISSIVFRVASAPRGTLQDGRMTYQLIQDPYYIWRSRVVSHPISVGVDSGVGTVLSGG